MIKKYSIPIFALLVCLLVVFSGCAEEKADENELNDYIEATAYEDSGVRTDFSCTLVEKGKYSITVVSVKDGSTKIVVSVSGSTEITDENGSTLSLDDLSEGKNLKITFDGKATQSDPIRISKCYKIEVVG